MRAAWCDIRIVFPGMSSRGHNLQNRPAYFPRLTLHISLEYLTIENPWKHRHLFLWNYTDILWGYCSVNRTLGNTGPAVWLWYQQCVPGLPPVCVFSKQEYHLELLAVSDETCHTKCTEMVHGKAPCPFPSLPFVVHVRLRVFWLTSSSVYILLSLHFDTSLSPERVQLFHWHTTSLELPKHLVSLEVRRILKVLSITNCSFNYWYWKHSALHYHHLGISLSPP